MSRFSYLVGRFSGVHVWPVLGVPRGVWGVSGDLTLHGVTRRVSVDVIREDNAYVGTTRIKQTEFGIQPIKIGGGVVKVKDELEIHFKVFTVSR